MTTPLLTPHALIQSAIMRGFVTPPAPAIPRPPKSVSLYAQVRHFVRNKPDATTDEIYNHVRPNFQNENPRWLRNQINQYKHRK